MERINLSHILNTIKGPYLEIVSKYEKIPKYLIDNLNSFFSICVAAEIERLLGEECDPIIDWQKFVVISDEKSLKVDRSMILKSISIIFTKKGPGIHFISDSEKNFSDQDYSLFLACTHSKDIYLNSQNLELLKAYFPIKKLFLGFENRIVWPRQIKLKNLLLKFLSIGLSGDRHYSEKEINDYLSFFHKDFALLRRYMIELKYLYRLPDGSKYSRHYV
ncbi:DUF2087 domain-containing protein [Leptospira saintgironsiae]|uniref:DUF2087 domain-containing protein n=1 Tax=Leptospira saintgironsiae TaxID=2023183 RepID=A0A2M9Y7C9_9LEPT|nr:DUF2087 domain-containing protein [Leptospira saintgironsiae]PJZ47490.1 hypothetical protein CH362_18865 [Leptospira saintgironsiae]